MTKSKQAIGNSIDAQIIYDFHHFHEENHMLDGWKLLGEGCTRTAYLSPGGTVYKVGESNTNLVESSSSRRFHQNKKLAEQKIFVPRARNWRVKPKTKKTYQEYVLAMEYVKGRPTECRSSYRKECNCRSFGSPWPCYSSVINHVTSVGILDMFSENILHGEDNNFYVIDLGWVE